MVFLPSECFDFYVCSQDVDGPLNPPSGTGWVLIATNAAEDSVFPDGDEARPKETAAVLIATWARPKTAASSDVGK